MHSAITIVTPPTAEPVILAEVKACAKIDIDDDDALLATYLTSAIESAQEYTRRTFINRTLKLTLDAPRSGLDRFLGDGVHELPVSALSAGYPNAIELPMGPVSSITSVVTYSQTGTQSTFSSSNYRLDSASGRIVLNYGCYWPADLRCEQGVEITYVAGYGATSNAVPSPIKTAIIQHAAKMYDAGYCCEAGADTERLLKQYRRMSL